MLRLDRPVVLRLGRGTGATTVALHPVAGPPVPAPTGAGSTSAVAGPPNTAPPIPVAAGPSQRPGRDTTVHFVTSGRLTIGRLRDVLAVQLAVLLGVAAWLLRRQDPVRR
ncbi:hypothetical protein FHX44_111877 [Pseudonocardia hierapolitana]|uniref:Uncharacterized protein n=1 Tax=Pseudonocardia hierapolitana TaxID=1128676 RepID=A0A561SM98_9PSEU|nr:hypothetical protein [Pseudonocardia hierapolitana]TWF75990.1 hypothetical protein FHX44_111877 [Pseudonocardia hierapolitana]